jgi:predicted CoA-binding protein
MGGALMATRVAAKRATAVNAKRATAVKRKAPARAPAKATASGVDHDNYTDSYLRGILGRVKTIAMVGASTNWNRPSYFAMKYLQHKGYRVIPVNPGAAGQILLGEKVYANLKEIPDKIDMVDIFRNSAAAGPIVDEAIEIGAPVVWMQLGVRNDEAAAKAEAAGVKVVMNRCPKIEYGRLSGEIGWNGVNSRVISSKKPIMRSGFQSFGVRQK